MRPHGVFPRVYKRHPRELETPGPKQLRVLEVLAVALAAGYPFMSPETISEASGVPVGSVKGCISGMVNLSQRHWLKRNRNAVCITPEGMGAMLKHYREAANSDQIELHRDKELQQIAVDLEYAYSRIENVRLATMDQNPGGWRDVMYSAIRKLKDKVGVTK